MSKVFQKHPRPWKVELEDGLCWGIVDANGRKVVETDSGFYEPDEPTAQLIVDVINALPQEK